MSRKRMIDPNIWLSEDFAKLSTLGKLVFIGLFSNADDEGRGRANPLYLKSILFPYDENLRATDMEKTLQEIASHMSITLYKQEEKEYYILEHWKCFQTINKPTSSKIPLPEDYATMPVALPLNRIEENKKEKEIEENTRGSASFCKPSVAEIHAYCQERKNMVDAQQFYDFYESKGWKVGNQPMKEWRAAVRTWQRRQTAAQQQKSVADKKGFSQREYSREEREKREIDNYAELEAIYGKMHTANKKQEDAPGEEAPYIEKEK